MMDKINIKWSILLLLIFNVMCGQQRTNTQPTAYPNAQNMRAGAFIDVNAAGYAQSNYTIEQLVKKVLIDGGDCGANITNVVVSPNLTVSSPNRSWGYFNKGTTAFPFAEGIVLNTGRVYPVGNTLATSPLGAGVSLGTNGDVDLANAIGVASSSLRDVTYIEFDFVPVNDEISFNYIFASEEYQANNNYSCQYTDGFALLLKKVGDPNYTNLAVLPGGAGPVNVTNIHAATSATCGAVNEEYFHGFNTANVETNYGGRTIPLTAVASVEPGETYHFKMVLADQSDGKFDSGVFLEAGSFNIGVQFIDEDGVALPESVSICEGDTQNLMAQVENPGATFQWSFNGVEIAGATASSYSATEAGVYFVNVVVPGYSCPINGEIEVVVNSLPEANDTSLSICSGGNEGVFNLTSAQGAINSSAGMVFSYYANLGDANAGNTNTIANPSAYTSGNATVYVLVSDGNCKAVAELSLVIDETPETPTITASSMLICGDDTVTLTSSAAAGNSWSTGETNTSINVTEGGVYTLSVSSGGCVSETASVTIVKTDNPNLQITGANFFCEGGSTTLTATADGVGNTYLWSDGTTAAENTVSAGGIYTVTVTTSTGCEFQESITVTAGATPEVQNATLEQCSTQETAVFDLTSAEGIISTVSGASFTYYLNENDAVAGNANAIANTTAYDSTTATIYVRVGIGDCFEIAELQLNHTSTPTAIITSSSTVICGVGTVTLTSNYSTGNVWSTGETTQNITVSTAGTYSLTINNGDCVSETVSVEIEQNDDPNIQITGDVSFCFGASTTLTANTTGSGLTYLWSNGATTQTATFNQAGTYTVTVTTSGGCEFSETVTLTTDGEINAVIAQPQEVDCANPSIALDATSSVVESNATIVWVATNGGNIVSGGNTLSPVVDSGGTYTLTITSTEGNLCTDTSAVTVVENVTPPVIALAANKSTICVGESVTLTASGAVEYTWTGGGVTGGGVTQVVSPTSNQTYTVTGIGANGCSGNTATISINVVPAIESTLANIQFCKGLSGTLDAGYVSGYTYQWSTGESTPTINVTDVGVYNVTISNGVCSETYSATVTYTPVPVIQMVEYNDNTIKIILSEDVPNPEFSIDGGVTWQSSAVFVNVSPNVSYNILVREAGESCYSSTEFYAFNVNNLITPNNDGYNDTVDFSAVSKNAGFAVFIYDKYGKVVFEGTPTKNVWDGTYVSFKLPTDTYWYHIKWEDPISKTIIKKEGWIMLKNRID